MANALSRRNFGILPYPTHPSLDPGDSLLLDATSHGVSTSLRVLIPAEVTPWAVLVSVLARGLLSSSIFILGFVDHHSFCAFHSFLRPASQVLVVYCARTPEILILA